MKKKESKAPWTRWDEEVKKFKAIKGETFLPPDILHAWRNHFLLLFMQDLSKNLLHGPFDLLLDKIIEAIQVGMGFRCVRVYLVGDEMNRKDMMLRKTSPDHEPDIREEKNKYRLPLKEGIDEAIDTLFSGEPFLLEEGEKAKLFLNERLKIEGPYFAIPLLVEGAPFGLICANNLYSSSSPEAARLEAESVSRVETFARAIMAAVENRQISEQRNRQIKQLQAIDSLSLIIQSETDKKSMYNTLLALSVLLVNGESGHLKLYNARTKRLERVADYGDDIAPDDIKFKPEEIGFSNHVFETQEALVIGNIQMHQLMKKHREYCEREGHSAYLETLKSRRSAIIMPLQNIKNAELITIGVLDIHSQQENQFDQTDFYNLKSLMGSVAQAIEKNRQMEQLQEFIRVREQYLEMLRQALAKADDLNCVLEIIRKSCFNLVNRGNLEVACLSVKDPQTGDLITPTIKCIRAPGIDCKSCINDKHIIREALNTKKPQSEGKTMALPFLHEREIIGILYLEGKDKIELTDYEKETLDMIISTAAILIRNARNYETRIKQVATLYELTQNVNQMMNFRQWFHPIMEQVVKIMGRNNRCFHLVLVEEEENEKKLFIRETSDLYVEGKPPESFKEKLLNHEVPMGKSLCGLVFRTKETQINHDIEKNNKKSADDPTKLPYHIVPRLPFKAEAAIPLKIKIKTPEEAVIGVLVIHSIVKNDFQDFDVKFHETIADYLAMAIYNQRMYEERARYQTEIYGLDRSLALQALMISFFHDITPPVQEICFQVSIMKEETETERQKNRERLEILSDKLINNYNEFVRDFGQSFTEPSVTSIKETIKNSLETVEQTRGLEGIQLSGNYQESNEMIECYAVFIEMAFRAIIHNAVKYSRGLSPEKRYLKIDVESVAQDNQVSIAFESSSTLRIPDEKDKQIFKPFFRGTGKVPGHGLGLSIASECIHFHDGDIKADNVTERPAVIFSITLPKNLNSKKEDTHG